MIRFGMVWALLLSVAVGASEVAYVELEKGLLETADGKNARAAMEAETKKQQDALSKQEAEVKKLQEAFEKGSAKFSEKERETKMQALQDKAMALQAFYQKSQNDLMAFQKKTMEPLLQRSNLVLEKLESQGGYNFILNSNPMFTLYATPKVDLTKQFTHAYESAFAEKKPEKNLNVAKLNVKKGLKVGYVDMERVIAQLNDAMVVKAKLQTEFQMRQGKLEGRQAELRALQGELQKLKDANKTKEMATKEAEFRSKMGETQQLYSSMQQDLARMEQTEMTKMMQDFAANVGKIAEQSGFAFVFNQSPQGLIYGGDAMDLTNTLVERVNAKQLGALSSNQADVGMALDKVKFGYIDLEAAMGQIKEGATLQKRLEAEQLAKSEEFKKEEASIVELESKLKKQKSMLKPEVLQERVMDIQKRRLELEQKLMQAQQGLMQQRQQEAQGMLAKMKIVLEGIGKEKKLTAVINKSPGSLLLGKPQFDVTNEAIRKYNAAYAG